MEDNSTENLDNPEENLPQIEPILDTSHEALQEDLPPKILIEHEKADEENPDENFFDIYDYYLLTDHSNVLVSYKGPVTDIIMAEISRDIRNKFADNAQVSKKLFSIFMELSQNILYYSAERVQFGERNDSVGVILITKNSGEAKHHYRFSCGNLVESSYVEELMESCELINSMNREELREYKRERRSQPQGERSKGAGIGLIQVALTSGNPLNVEFRKVDENFSFFSISVEIG